MKTSGLGDRLFVAGYDLSGDITAINSIAGSVALLDVTAINKSAHERLGGVRDGSIDLTAWFNDAAGQEHPVLRALPSTDVHLMYCRGTSIGNAGAALIGKQADYKAARGADGSMTFGVQALANGYGLEADGRLLTAGLRTDTGATNGASDDELAGSPASTEFGWSAYLQVTAFDGTDVTVKIQDSADDAAWADLSGAAFTAITSAPTYERKQSASATATVRRYLRAVTTTSGGFTSVSFVVLFIRPRELRAF